jgi:hypothetical protein
MTSTQWIGWLIFGIGCFIAGWGQGSYRGWKRGMREMEKIHFGVWGDRCPGKPMCDEAFK